MLFYHANQLGITTCHHAVLTVVRVIKRSQRSALRSHAGCHAIRTLVQTTVFKWRCSLLQLSGKRHVRYFPHSQVWADEAKIAPVLQKFAEYCKNVLSERYRFNRRVQDQVSPMTNTGLP